ncbi:MAG: hypothetical protein ACYSU0_15395, partial [Planctomycetota bacterium]
ILLLPYQHSADARVVVEWEMGRGASLVAGWRWMTLFAEGESVDTSSPFGPQTIISEMRFYVTGPTVGFALRF